VSVKAVESVAIKSAEKDHASLFSFDVFVQSLFSLNLNLNLLFYPSKPVQNPDWANSPFTGGGVVPEGETEVRGNQAGKERESKSQKKKVSRPTSLVTPSQLSLSLPLCLSPLQTTPIFPPAQIFFSVYLDRIIAVSGHKKSSFRDGTDFTPRRCRNRVFFFSSKNSRRSTFFLLPPPRPSFLLANPTNKTARRAEIRVSSFSLLLPELGKRNAKEEEERRKKKKDEDDGEKKTHIFSLFDFVSLLQVDPRAPAEVSKATNETTAEGGRDCARE
jgi:hypothetical protein